jgi:thiamine biosynthesis lipoprotein
MTTSGGKVFRPRVVVALLVAILALPLYMMYVGWRSGDESVRNFFGPTMGTRYSVSLAGGSSGSSDLEEVQRQVAQRLSEINGRMSTYDPNSELSRFNQFDGGEWFSVSTETAEVVAAALDVAERTSGAFDPTVGPVVNLWGFGPNKKRPELPADEAIAEALSRVGYEKVVVRVEPPALKKTAPELYLDLSGIAKGYASDAVSKLLGELGCENTMVEIGGEVRTRGVKSGNSPWRIGVERPGRLDGSLQSVVLLKDAGMATSGDYHNFFKIQGTRYSHTIDPATGMPVTHSLAAVSVVAPTCMEADALATALLVMGEEKGYDWCSRHDIKAMFLTREGEQIHDRATPGFQQLLDEEMNAE